MKRAPEAIVRCGMLASTRAQCIDIRRQTRERLYQLLGRLVDAEWRLRFGAPSNDRGVSSGSSRVNTGQT